MLQSTTPALLLMASRTAPSTTSPSQSLWLLPKFQHDGFSGATLNVLTAQCKHTRTVVDGPYQVRTVLPWVSREWSFLGTLVEASIELLLGIHP